jgi:hypothetical protein
VVDDYDVVLLGVAQMLDPYRDRVLIAELDINNPSPTASTSSCTTPSPNPSPTTTRSAS